VTLQPVLEIGGTHTTVAVADVSKNTITYQERWHIDPEAPAPDLLEAITGRTRSAPLPAARQWGVAIPGPFDYANGIGDFTGIGKFTALHGVDVGAELRQRLPGNPERIVFLNDAEAFAIGEWQLVSPPPARAVFLTLGTGVGSSFLRDGRPVTQWPGIPEDGHVHRLEWRGQPLEAFSSRRAIQYHFAAATDRQADVREIADLARGGNRAASSVLTQCYRILGEAIAPSIAAFETELLVVGGSITGSWDLVGPPLYAGLRQGLAGVAPVPDVRRAQANDTSPLLGAAIATVRHAEAEGAN
jgi:glucokinase